MFKMVKEKTLFFTITLTEHYNFSKKTQAQ